MKPGFVIAIVGAESTGKSTLAAALCAALRAEGHDAAFVPEYLREFCDRLFFAVAPSFPREVLPEDAGLIVADRYGGEILRPGPEHRLAGARRKAMTLRLVRTAALRLQGVIDPDGGFEALLGA